MSDDLDLPRRPVVLGAARSGLAAARALTAYEASRFRRAGAVVIASRRQGAVYHMRRPLDLGRDAVMRALGAEGMMKRMDWLYAAQP